MRGDETNLSRNKHTQQIRLMVKDPEPPEEIYIKYHLTPKRNSKAIGKENNRKASGKDTWCQDSSN